MCLAWSLSVAPIQLTCNTSICKFNCADYTQFNQSNIRALIDASFSDALIFQGTLPCGYGVSASSSANGSVIVGSDTSVLMDCRDSYSCAHMSIHMDIPQPYQLK